MSKKKSTPHTPTPSGKRPASGGKAGASAKGGSAGQRPSARERLKAERAREEGRAKRRRTMAVAGSSLAVLGLAAGLGIAVSGGGGSDSANTAANQPLKIPANTSGPGNTVIAYGDADSRNTLKIYEDLRCPYCAEFEKANSATVEKLADQGRFKVEYHFGTFLDEGLGGQGSERALAALGAAVNESKAKFLEYHRVLYANQPSERDDAFASTDRLLELASEVQGLRTPAFDKAVGDLTYLPWAEKVSQAFDKSGITGTPTVLLNDKKLTVLNEQGAVSPKEFTATVDKQLGAK